MSQWGAVRAKRLLAALLRSGWTIKRESGSSHRTLSREDWPDVVFAFHDADEIGPRMVASSRETHGAATRGSLVRCRTPSVIRI
jgi:predicted RNA binding protein YcfA (HicA-like mRNA interferase family)